MPAVLVTPAGVFPPPYIPQKFLNWVQMIQEHPDYLRVKTARPTLPQESPSTGTATARPPGAGLAPQTLRPPADPSTRDRCSLALVQSLPSLPPQALGLLLAPSRPPVETCSRHAWFIHSLTVTAPALVHSLSYREPTPVHPPVHPHVQP